MFSKPCECIIIDNIQPCQKIKTARGWNRIVFSADLPANLRPVEHKSVKFVSFQTVINREDPDNNNSDDYVDLSKNEIVNCDNADNFYSDGYTVASKDEIVNRDIDLVKTIKCPSNKVEIENDTCVLHDEFPELLQGYRDREILKHDITNNGIVYRAKEQAAKWRHNEDRTKVIPLNGFSIPDEWRKTVDEYHEQKKWPLETSTQWSEKLEKLQLNRREGEKREQQLNKIEKESFDQKMQRFMDMS